MLTLTELLQFCIDCNLLIDRDLPEVKSASEGGGGHGKADVVREVA